MGNCETVAGRQWVVPTRILCTGGLLTVGDPSRVQWGDGVWGHPEKYLPSSPQTTSNPLNKASSPSVGEMLRFEKNATQISKCLSIACYCFHTFWVMWKTLSSKYLINESTPIPTLWEQRATLTKMMKSTHEQLLGITTSLAPLRPNGIAVFKKLRHEVL